MLICDKIFSDTMGVKLHFAYYINFMKFHFTHVALKK